jgi:hypothetical protein
MPIAFYGLVLAITGFRFYAPMTKESRIDQQPPNESLLLDIWQRQSYDPKDKYFAVLSFLRLAKTAQPGLPSVPGQSSNFSKLDYSSTTIDTIYFQLFHGLLDHGTSLTILLFAGLHHTSRFTDCLDTPSWLVDWRHTTPFWLLTRYRYGYRVDRHDDSTDDMTLWRRVRKVMPIKSLPPETRKKPIPGATPGSQSSWAFDGHSTHGALVVRGSVIGTIHFSSGPWPAVTDKSSILEIGRSLNVLTREFNVINELPGLRPLNPDLHLDHLAALAGQPFNLVYADLYTRWMRKGASPDTMAREIRTARRARRPSSSWSYHKKLTGALRKEHVGIARYRGTLGTDAGKYFFGTVPEITREGDLIALVAGVSLPLILRPVGSEGFKLVGPATFDHIMYGMAWKQVDQENMGTLRLV